MQDAGDNNGDIRCGSSCHGKDARYITHTGDIETGFHPGIAREDKQRFCLLYI